MEDLEGLVELLGKMDHIILRLQRGALTKAAQAMAKIVRDEAASNAPRRSGRLAAGMTTTTRQGTASADFVEVDVGPGRKQFYGYFEEFGTGTKFESGTAQSAGYPGHGTAHRLGTAPQPFLLPALDRKREEAEEAAAAILWAAITEDL